MGGAVAVVLVAAALVVAVAFAAEAVEQVRTFGDAGDGEGLVGPHAQAVAVAADGTVLVADTMDGRLERFDTAGAPLGGWGGLDAPSAVAVDAAGRVIVGDGGRVLAFAPDGKRLGQLAQVGEVGGLAAGRGGALLVTDRAGGSLLVLGSDGAPARSFGELDRPGAVAVARNGDVFVAEPEQVVRLSSDGVQQAAWPVAGVRGLAVGRGGEVYAAEGTAQRVGIFSPDGQRVGELAGGAPRLNVPTGVALDCRGAIYVVDNSNPRGHVFAVPGTPPPPCPLPPAPTPEPTPEPTPQPTVQPTPEPAPEAVVAAEQAEQEQPVLGRTVRATRLSGTVYVDRGSARRRLDGSRIVPVGTTLDTSAGAVRLELETAAADRAHYGRYMEGDFSGGAFTVNQAATASLAELQLEPTGAAARGRRAVASARRKVARVWGKARGRFRTVGRHGAATVRGTRWLTEERRRGTYVRVVEGQVEVREFATGRTVVLGPGESFLARPRCLSQRRFRIHLLVPLGTIVERATVLVGQRRVPVGRGSRPTAVIDLRGRPKSTVRVRISVRTAAGRRLTGRRVYHTCRSGPAAGHAPPEL